MTEMGKITYRQRAKQINDFRELLYCGEITPTDIDGMIEYHNNAYVFFEVKYNGADVPFGQRKAIARLVDDVKAAGKKAVALIVNHQVDNPDDDVPVGSCLIREVYYCDDPKWKPLSKPTTAKEYIDRFLKYVDGLPSIPVTIHA
jgi:hypothetical protein